VALVVQPAPTSQARLYDASGRSTWEGSLPFDTPVAYPLVTSLGEDEFLVAAVPCTTVRLEEDATTICEPGGVALARFTPSRRTFTVLTADRIEGTTLIAEVVGSHGSDLVVQLGPQLYLLPRNGGDASPLPLSPLEAPTIFCVQGDRVVAVERRFGNTTDLTPGESVVESPYFEPFKASVLDLATTRWTEPVGPGDLYEGVDTFTLACLDDGALAVADERPMAPGAPYTSYVFDLTDGRWHDAPVPPREFVASSPPSRDGSKVAFSITGSEGDSEILVFDRATGSWSSTPGGRGADAVATAFTTGQFWDVPRLTPGQSTAEPPTVTDLPR
jgi:hypothetical protein